MIPWEGKFVNGRRHRFKTSKPAQYFLRWSSILLDTDVMLDA
jgi:hypothetical protein